MKKAILVTMTALALAALLPATASAQATGTMAVDVNLPEIVILYYYNSLTFNVDATSLVSRSGAISLGTPTFTTFTPPALVFSDPEVGGTLGDLSNVGVTLTNAWGVRALTSNGTVDVSFTGPGTLDNRDATDPTVLYSQMEVKDVTVNVTSGATDIATGTDTATINIPSPGLATATLGNLGFTLDMSDVSASGDYIGSFTIEASAP